MKCNSCGVFIDYKTAFCPICGARCDCENLTELFPKPPTLTNKKPNKISIRFVSLVSILSICLILFIINIITFKTLAWALIAVPCILLIYLIIFFNPKYSVALRNIITILGFIATFYIIGYLLKAIPFVTYNILPNTFAFFTLINLAAFFLFDKHKYFFSTLTLATLCFVPIILFACAIKISIVISLVSIVVGVISILTILITNRKYLKTFFSSFFHF